MNDYGKDLYPLWKKFCTNIFGENLEYLQIKIINCFLYSESDDISQGIIETNDSKIKLYVDINQLGENINNDNYVAVVDTYERIIKRQIPKLIFKIEKKLKFSIKTFSINYLSKKFTIELSNFE